MVNGKSYLIGFDASRAFVSEATGTENYSLNLLRALSKVDRKNRYRVYLRKISNFKFQISNFKWPKNFEFVEIRPYRFWTQIGLALETWRNPVDILFIPAHTLPIFRRRKIGIFNFQFEKFSFGKAIFNFFANRIKYVVTIHDLGVEYLPGYHQFPQRYYLDFASKYACRSADAIIAVSDATKADIVKRYRTSPKKVFVVHEGVDTAFFRSSSKLKVQSVKLKYKIKGDYILFVGTVQPRKNLEMLIRAFARVCRMVGEWDGGSIDLQLVIAGKLGWDYREILNAPKKFGVEKQIKFLGYISKEDLPVLYSGACVFVFPSLFEGFGLPILEAISCGCPVVASDIGPHREIFREIMTNDQTPKSKNLEFGKCLPDLPSAIRRRAGKLGFSTFSKVDEPMILVKPYDIDRWSNVLYQYLSQYNKKILRIKKENLGSKFSWDLAANETLKIFKGMLG